MNYQYIQDTYKVPAEHGRRVRFKGEREGLIIRDLGNYIGVNFDDMKPGHVESLHPTWKVEYLGMGKERPMTAGQKRYQCYLRSEYPGTFMEFLQTDYWKL